MEPVLLGLFLADRVIKEINGKTGIIGIFDNFNIQDITKPSPPFFVYAAITNVEGECEFTFNLVRDDHPNVVFSIGGKINSKSDENTIELIFPVGGIPFPAYGKYNLTISVGASTPLGSRTIRVSEAQPPTGR